MKEEICKCGHPHGEHQFFDYADGGTSVCNTCNCSGFKKVQIPQDSAWQPEQK